MSADNRVTRLSVGYGTDCRGEREKVYENIAVALDTAGSSGNATFAVGPEVSVGAAVRVVGSVPRGGALASGDIVYTNYYLLGCTVRDTTWAATR